MFSWRLQSPENTRGVNQVAYQIRSAHNDPELDTNPLWNSGKVISDSTAVSWKGLILRSRERVCWQVQVWDSEGRTSGWSDVASFEMGLVSARD
jgi:alpha-L-rhamnosidase